MRIFTAMGKPRREIMFDTIDISNIACRDRAGECNTNIDDAMKLFADMLAELERGHDLVCGIREGREEKGIGAENPSSAPRSDQENHRLPAQAQYRTAEKA